MHAATSAPADRTYFMVFGSSIAGYSGGPAMTRKLYLVIIFVVLAAVVATGAYLRQRGKIAAEAVKCDTPAPPPPPTAPPPPKLPGFAIEAPCGTGGEAKPPAEGPGM